MRSASQWQECRVLRPCRDPLWLTAATICGCCGNDGMIESFGMGFPQSDLHPYQRTSSRLPLLSSCRRQAPTKASPARDASHCICDPYSPKGVTLARPWSSCRGSSRLRARTGSSSTTVGSSSRLYVIVALLTIDASDNPLYATCL